VTNVDRTFSLQLNFETSNTPSQNHTTKSQQTQSPIMSADALFGQGIFEDLQRKIDEDTTVKDVSGGGNRTKNPQRKHKRHILTFTFAGDP
jgi:hypothetical protein